MAGKSSSSAAVTGLLIIAAAVCGICGCSGGKSENTTTTGTANFYTVPNAPKQSAANFSTPANKTAPNSQSGKAGATMPVLEGNK